MQRPLLTIALLLTLTGRADALTMGVFTGHAPCTNIFGTCDLSNPQYLSGNFFLDETTPFDVTVSSLGSGGFLTSPLQTIEGQFGEYTFQGSATPVVFGQTFDSSVVLLVFDFREVLDLQTDSWILRTALTGPTVNGISPTLLNLFIRDVPSDSRNTISIFPPLNRCDDCPEFFNYFIGFSDGSFAQGQLSSVQVPDAGPTWLLMLMAGAGLVALRPRVRPQTPHGDTSFDLQ